MADKLSSILEAYVAKGEDTKDKLLGAAFIVVNKDGVLYQGSAGRIDLPTSSPAFDENSFTRVASMTKIIAATSVMQIVERGLIGLDDDVRSLVPELAGMQILQGFEDTEEKPILVDNDRPITLGGLLTHTVGLAYDLGDADLQRWSTAIGRTTNTLTCTREGWTTPLKFAPGDGWYYGTSNDWAGLVLQAVTGQTLGEYMKENIFEKLGMRDTAFRSKELEEKVTRRKVELSYRGEGGALSVGPVPIVLEPPVDSGGAGLWMTAADHIKVVQGLVKAITGDEGGLLKKETADELFRPQLNENQRTHLKNMVIATGMAQDFNPDTPADWGLGGAINLEDLPDRRKKGSMMWGGMCNANWVSSGSFCPPPWIDPKTGIGATFFASVLPFPDPVVKKLYRELEAAVYELLLSQ
ncbi:beta-lactamase/transpeptidase-like protein [Podospora australis]|uniref:Beta-lactamase/transpeptidase-like protein n=1 Tax=Podospora australis TaxID=1536484 RepID=A0AAN6WV00_9PEZI|nr:beta-lactamase/transpeptidase-like protein [Podospora australis]